MQTELIKLKVKKEASFGIGANTIKQIFIESCLRLDASIFEPLINEDIFFKNKDKYRFLASLQKEFNSWKSKKVTKTHLIEGKCNGCHLGHKVYQFYTHELPLRCTFSYIIHEEQNQIADIFMCNSSDGMQTVGLDKLREFDFWKTK